MCLWQMGPFSGKCQRLATHFLLQQWLHRSSDSHKKAKEVAERWQTVQANYGRNAQSAVYEHNTTSGSRPFCWRHYMKRMRKSPILYKPVFRVVCNEWFLLPKSSQALHNNFVIMKPPTLWYIQFYLHPNLWDQDLLNVIQVLMLMLQLI